MFGGTDSYWACIISELCIIVFTDIQKLYSFMPVRNSLTNIKIWFFFQLGAYHTLDLELNRKFILTKNEWDSVALERIDSACDVTQNADLAAVVMQEGLAHLCLVTASMTIVKAKIEQVIPRKRQGNVQQHEKVIYD